MISHCEAVGGRGAEVMVRIRQRAPAAPPPLDSVFSDQAERTVGPGGGKHWIWWCYAAIRY